MRRKSRGRGTAATFGLLLLFAGLVGGGVLYVMSVNRPGDMVDGFARAAVGCTTTLEFTQTGDFYVFEELGPAGSVELFECAPSPVPGRTFAVEAQPGHTLEPAPDLVDVDVGRGLRCQRLDGEDPGVTAGGTGAPADGAVHVEADGAQQVGDRWCRGHA